MKTLWIALYVASILLANLTLDKFIELPALGDFPAFGMLSVGTLFFAFVFTLRDKLHQFGLPTVFLAIGLALVVNAGAAIWLDTPFRFIAASFIAIAASELADTAMYQKLMARSWLTRALTSNAISVPLDTILFTLLAFYGVMSSQEMLEIIYADLVFKTLIAAALAVVLALGIKREPTAEAAA